MMFVGNFWVRFSILDYRSQSPEVALKLKKLVDVCPLHACDRLPLSVLLYETGYDRNMGHSGRSTM